MICVNLDVITGAIEWLRGTFCIGGCDSSDTETINRGAPIMSTDDTDINNISAPIMSTDDTQINNSGAPVMSIVDIEIINNSDPILSTGDTVILNRGPPIVSTGDTQIINSRAQIMSTGDTKAINSNSPIISTGDTVIITSRARFASTGNVADIIYETEGVLPVELEVPYDRDHLQQIKLTKNQADQVAVYENAVDGNVASICPVVYAVNGGPDNYGEIPVDVGAHNFVKNDVKAQDELPLLTVLMDVSNEVEESATYAYRLSNDQMKQLRMSQSNTVCTRELSVEKVNCSKFRRNRKAEIKS